LGSRIPIETKNATLIAINAWCSGRADHVELRTSWLGVRATQRVCAKKAVHHEHGARHETPAGRSVYYDLFPKAEAEELVMRSTLLRDWNTG
jgi:hypothetical protein